MRPLTNCIQSIKEFNFHTHTHITRYIIGWFFHRPVIKPFSYMHNWFLYEWVSAMIFWANVIVIHIDIYVRNDVTARFQEWYMHYWLILDGKLLESIKQCLIAWHIFIKEENHSKSRKKNYDLSLSWCLNKIKCFRLHALYAIHFSWNAIHIRPNCDDFFSKSARLLSL